LALAQTRKTQVCACRFNQSAKPEMQSANHEGGYAKTPGSSSLALELPGVFASIPQG
jgi:hypothetical protein